MAPGDYRDVTWKRFGEEVFDLLVIGGGINGAGVARDAVLRGMSVALVEKGDFACGTSSRSSKLIHGGVRYLEHGDVALVLEACRERDLLRTRIAPHLVRAQRFLFPVYDDDPTPLWQLRFGLLAYDALAVFRNVERHSALNRKQVREREPALLADGLVGGALYYDCATDDARLTLENMLAARSDGAAVLNYVELQALEKDSAGRLAAALVCDRITRRSVRVRARSFVNVTGPWLDVVRKLDDGGAPPRLKVTKGVHAVFERARIGNNDAIVIRGAGDDRVMFAIPWQDRTLVGTTDTYYEGDPGAVSVDADDIDYLLATVNWAFPGADVTAADVVSSYAGLRPLVAPEDELDESAVSREDSIFESPAGLISLGGGKLTTHRHVAERMVDLAVARSGRRTAPCRTARVPLPGAAGIRPGEVYSDLPASNEEHLRRRYGALAGELGGLLAERGGGRLADDVCDLEAEVLYAVDCEMAVGLEDVLARRLHLGLRSRGRGAGVATRVATLMGQRLGWDATEQARQVESYLAALGGQGDGV